MSEMTPAQIDDLATKVFAAIEAGDLGAVAALWADDVEVWHNTDGVVQSKDQNLAVMAWMFRHTSSLEYCDMVRHVVDGGFVQRHVLRATFDDLGTADVPAAMFVEVSEGQVARIDEYLDSAQVSAAFPAP